MDIRDIRCIKRLVKWITENAEYGDIDELCEELKVPTEWFERFYEWEDEDDKEEAVSERQAIAYYDYNEFN